MHGFLDGFGRKCTGPYRTEQVGHPGLTVFLQFLDTFCGRADDCHAECFQQLQIDAEFYQAAKASQIVKVLIAGIELFQHRQRGGEERIVEPRQRRFGELAGTLAVGQADNANGHAGTRRRHGGRAVEIIADVVFHHHPRFERAGQHAQLLLRCPGESIRTDRCSPQRRVRGLHRVRQDIQCIQLIMFTMIGNGTAQEGLAQDRQRLRRAAAAVAHGGAEHAIFLGRETTSDTQFQTPAGEDVQGCDALGNMHRVVVGQRHHAQAQADAPGALAGRGQHQIGLGRMRVAAHEVMLDQPRTTETQAIGQLDFGQGIGECLRLAARQMRWLGNLVKQVELHGRSGSQGAVIMPAS